MAVQLISFMFPGIPGVRCAFQTRPSDAGDAFAGNISLSATCPRAQTERHRAELAAAFGVPGMAELHQVHGDMTVFDPEPLDAGTAPACEGDGMATQRPGLALMIKTADCQPILLAHRSGRYVAALHVGWRGNRINYPMTGVRAFCAKYGLDPADVLAVRGPSLGPAAAEFVNFNAEWGPEFVAWFDARQHSMDLWRLTRDQLLRAGLLEKHLFSLDLCTFSLPACFFSYRRDKHSGRQASIIQILAG